MCGRPVVAPIANAASLDIATAVVFVLAFGLAALATSRRPAYGVAALITCEPFALYRSLGPTLVTLPKIVLIAVASTLIVTLRERMLDALRGTAARTLCIAAAAVVVATALSVRQAEFHVVAWRETLKSVEYLALLATVVVAARADYNERVIRLAVAVTLVAVSALALEEEVRGAASVLCFAGQPVPRIAGPLEGPNQLGAYLGIASCAVAAFAARRDGATLELIALAAAGTALVLTFSRMGLLAGCVGLAIVVATASRQGRRRVVLSAGTGVAVGVAAIAMRGALVSGSFGGLSLLMHFATLAQAQDTGTVGSRSQLYRAAYTLWRVHPFFGIGAGNFEFELARAGYPHVRTHANSLYLQALVEGGIPLAVATVAAAFAPIGRFWRGPFDEPLVVAALAASAGFAIHQLFDLLVFFPKVGELWWIVVALGAARFDAADGAVRRRTSPARRTSSRGTV